MCHLRLLVGLWALLPRKKADRASIMPYKVGQPKVYFCPRQARPNVWYLLCLLTSDDLPPVPDLEAEEDQLIEHETMDLDDAVAGAQAAPWPTDPIEDDGAALKWQRDPS